MFMLGRADERLQSLLGLVFLVAAVGVSANAHRSVAPEPVVVTLPAVPAGNGRLASGRV